MYKVVLVDDEETILNGLREIVRWGDYGCEVVACAANGEDGARAVRETGAQILLTDIRMPQMDGLQMIASLREEFPNLQITVLTAFRDFDYAQRAINTGVTKYLLKPSKMDDIYGALSEMTRKLDMIGSGQDAAPCASGQEEPEDGLGDLSRVDSFVARNALAYIRRHYAERITLQDVAEHAYVSQWHLSKLLKKHAGDNFVDILHGVRISTAKRMLKDPSLRVHDVAERVGYSDVAHFSKVFKRLTGMSAGEYRNQLKP